MAEALRLMAVVAHPDDESLGFGGTIAKYAAEGAHVSVVVATRGQAGRHGTTASGAPGHPGRDALGRIREAEPRAAAAVLDIDDLVVLDHHDGQLDSVKPGVVIAEIAAEIRRSRPHVVMTFAPDGAYGHPDHIAISQYTTAAIVAAASRSDSGSDRPHVVDKLYYLAWPADVWAVYEGALKKLVSRVDGVERRATPWPDWAITTAIDTRAHWPRAWRAVQCHASQVGGYQALAALPPAQHETLWGRQSYYRVFSTVSGGRQRERDLFEGLVA